MNKARILIILIVSITVLAPESLAWCVAGIGNTCGSRATEPHSFLGKYFNLDKPTQGNDDVGFFGSRPFKKEPASSGSSNINLGDLDEGDSKNIETDSGEPASVKYVTKRSVVVGDTEALFFDVDLIDISIRCPSCPEVDGEPLFTAGFDYLIDVNLQNGGNTLSEGVQLEVTAETLDQVKHYNFNQNALQLSPGEYKLEGLVFPKFGIEQGLIKEDYVFTGTGKQTFDILVTAKLSYSNGVSEPRIQQIKRTKRTCSGEGENFRCSTDVDYDVISLCPNGRSYSGIYSCGLDDPDDQNTLAEVYTLKKLTTDLGSQLDIGII